VVAAASAAAAVAVAVARVAAAIVGDQWRSCQLIVSDAVQSYRPSREHNLASKISKLLELLRRSA